MNLKTFLSLAVSFTLARTKNPDLLKRTPEKRLMSRGETLGQK